MKWLVKQHPTALDILMGADALMTIRRANTMLCQAQMVAAYGGHCLGCGDTAIEHLHATTATLEVFAPTLLANWGFPRLWRHIPRYDAHHQIRTIFLLCRQCLILARKEMKSADAY